MQGVRVLDLSIALTGPYAVALLADQGAEVIKVERPGIGDIARWVGVAVNGMSSLYLVCNRGKRSIAVDLHTPDGVDIVRRLAAESDVVVQNFRPGVMDRLGLGYDDLREVNPDIIYVSLSGFGSTGPYRDRSAYDTVIQAYGGLAANQADPVDGVPVFLRQTAADKVTALYASQAIDRRAVRSGAGARRPAHRAVDDGRGRLVPLGRLGRQRGAARLRRVAELELRRRVPTDALPRRLGHRRPDVRPRLRRHVHRARRRRLRRPARRHHRRADPAPRGQRRAGGPLLRARRQPHDGRGHRSGSRPSASPSP